MTDIWIDVEIPKTCKGLICTHLLLAMWSVFGAVYINYYIYLPPEHMQMHLKLIPILSFQDS